MAAKLVVTLEKSQCLVGRLEVSLAVQSVVVCTIWNSYAEAV